MSKTTGKKNGNGAAISSAPSTNTTAANGSGTRTGNFNIFNGGKIRIDLTNTKYKLLRECALEMKWKVITAKKRNEGESTMGGAAGNEKVKKDKHYYANQHNHHQLELS